MSNFCCRVSIDSWIMIQASPQDVCGSVATNGCTSVCLFFRHSSCLAWVSTFIFQNKRTTENQRKELPMAWQAPSLTKFRKKKKQKIRWSNKNRFVSFPCTGKTVGFGPKPCKYSNPPVLAGNLPFSGIISILPFSLQNLPFFVFLEKSKICYSYCPKFSKNSTLNAS